MCCACVRPTAYRPGRCAESTPRGERPCMPQACLTGACPIRRRLVGGITGAPNSVRRGWSAGRSPGGKRSAQAGTAEGIRERSRWPRRATRRRAKPASPPAERRDAQLARIEYSQVPVASQRPTPGLLCHEQSLRCGHPMLGTSQSSTAARQAEAGAGAGARNRAVVPLTAASTPSTATRNAMPALT